MPSLTASYWYIRVIQETMDEQTDGHMMIGWMWRTTLWLYSNHKRNRCNDKRGPFCLGSVQTAKLGLTADKQGAIIKFDPRWVQDDVLFYYNTQARADPWGELILSLN